MIKKKKRQNIQDEPRNDHRDAILQCKSKTKHATQILTNVYIYSIYKLRLKQQHNLHCCCHCSMFDFPRSLIYKTGGENLL